MKYLVCVGCEIYGEYPKAFRTLEKARECYERRIQEAIDDEYMEGLTITLMEEHSAESVAIEKAIIIREGRKYQAKRIEF